MGLVNIGLEFLLRQQTDPVPVSIGIFLVYLSALSFVLIGIARHYRAEPPWIAMTAVWLVAILLVPVVFSMTYSSPARSILYQLPYFAMQRSEEHTSELQPLMRLSYAVFCLKKKKHNIK